jgi:folate-binding protein YgfZ
LRLTGEDAANFLQGQFTNDIRMVRADTGAYGLWLNVKGKVVADGFVLRGAAENEFLLVSYFSPAVVLRERLESHVIADDVSIADETEHWHGVSIVGDPGTAVAAKASVLDIRPFAGRRIRGPNTEWVFPSTARDMVIRLTTSLGMRAMTPDEVERRRIAAAIPAVPADIGPGDLPNEGGLEVDAISYTKGCYLGQEVMARLKSMGQVRRRLLRVEGKSDKPALPAPLFLGAKQVGELRSAVGTEAGFIGLAMVSLLHVTAGSELALAPETAPSLRVTDSP